MKVFPGNRQPRMVSSEMGFLSLLWQCPSSVADAESGELSLFTAALRRQVPLLETEPEMQSFFMNGRAGLQVIYPGGMGQLQKAFKEWERSSTSIFFKATVRCRDPFGGFCLAPLPGVEAAGFHARVWRDVAVPAL